MNFHQRAAKCSYGYNVEGATEILNCSHSNNDCQIIFLGNEITLCNPTTCPLLSHGEKQEMMDLDYVNGWKETPKIVKTCNEKGHVKKFKPHSMFRCVTVVTCEVCGYTYKIDSSD